MSQTWAIARQMISEAIRMKIALVFLVLIGAVVLGLPFSIEGDRSVTGRVQSFLTYGLTATGFFLGLLTIFMSRSLSDELTNRQIYLVMTKPIPRWQYVLGKWLGMTCFNAVFLTFAGLVMYGMVHYIAWAHPSLDATGIDAATLKNEVLVARHAYKTKLPDFRVPAEAEFKRNLEEGMYAEYFARQGGSPKEQREQEIVRLTAKYEAKWRVVGPLDSRVFRFERVLCDRSPDKRVHLRYKTEVSQYAPDEIFRGEFFAGDPRKGTGLYRLPVRHVVGRYHTVPIPADAVAADNTLTVEFRNVNPFADEPQFGNVIEFRRSDEVELLFEVGSFEGNFARLLALMMCKLMFLAAVALLMVTVFSFPVACLTALTVYVLAGTRSFLGEALDMASDDGAGLFDSLQEFAVQSIIFVYSALMTLIPDFARFNAVEDLVNGRNVSLAWVLQAIFVIPDPHASIPVKPGLVMQALIVLALAMLIFHRREVAEVSV